MRKVGTRRKAGFSYSLEKGEHWIRGNIIAARKRKRLDSRMEVLAKSLVT